MLNLFEGYPKISSKLIQVFKAKSRSIQDSFKTILNSKLLKDYFTTLNGYLKITSRLLHNYFNTTTGLLNTL